MYNLLSLSTCVCMFLGLHTETQGGSSLETNSLLFFIYKNMYWIQHFRKEGNKLRPEQEVGKMVQ